MSLNNEGEQLVQSEPGEENQSPSRGSKKWIGAAAAAAAVVALSIGGVAVVNALGGGPQPEDVLPANAIAFVKLDLNPSAGQKLAAYQLASKIPEAKKKITSEETSIKEAVFGSLFTGSAKGGGFGLDYKKDVQPWLGDRVGMGVFPDSDGDKQPEFGIAFAYTDQSAAKVALDKAIANEAKGPAMSHGSMPNMPDTPSDKPEPPAGKPSTTGYAFADGFVIVSDTTAHATALVNAGKSGTLAKSKSKYVEDVKGLGSDQIGVAWADIAAFYKAIPKDQKANPLGPLMGLKGPQDPSNASGRVVMGLHADPSFLEVTGKGIEVKGADTLFTAGARTEAGILASFPSDVIGAVTVTGLGKAAGTLYTSLTTGEDGLGIKTTLNEVGIDSAKEIETLLGDETGIMLSGTMASPQFAIRTRGKDANAALAIARKALSSPAAEIDMVTAAKITAPDGIVVSMSPGLTKSIFDKVAPKLGGSEAFRQALPDADKADMAQYMNISKLTPFITRENHKKDAALKPLGSFGMTAINGNEATFRLRLTVK